MKSIMEYDSDLYHVNLGSVIMLWLESKLLDCVLIIFISENKPLMLTNIIFFDFKSCL